MWQWSQGWLRLVQMRWRKGRQMLRLNCSFRKLKCPRRRGFKSSDSGLYINIILARSQAQHSTARCQAGSEACWWAMTAYYPLRMIDIVNFLWHRLDLNAMFLVVYSGSPALLCQSVWSTSSSTCTLNGSGFKLSVRFYLFWTLYCNFIVLGSTRFIGY